MSDAFFSNAALTEVPVDRREERFAFNPTDINLLPVYDIAFFPALPVPYPIETEEDKESLRFFMENNLCFMAGFLTAEDNDPRLKRSYYPVGCVCKVLRIMETPGQTPMALILPAMRAQIDRIKRRTTSLDCSIIMLEPLKPCRDAMRVHLLEKTMESKYDLLCQYLPEEERDRLNQALAQYEGEPALKAYFMLSNSPVDYPDRVHVNSLPTVQDLLEESAKLLDAAVQEVELTAEIHRRTHVELNQEQKRQFIEQQIRNLQNELEGEGGVLSDADELRERAKKLNWSKEARNHFAKELKKLERLNQNSPDYSVQYNYLDTLLDLPWDKYSPDDFSLSKVEKILDRDHYGLEKVKERIVEHMAVLKLRNDMKAPILCLVGPPGVGKTSLGRSVADALGREYARVSLGGLHDEAEIRGHRKTYIGAMPGRIMAALEKCGTGNPVFVLDEIDKIGQDFKGDPSTALLEVLDPEQNGKFHDNFIDFDYDLSKILFIATANSLSTISGPLLDRMEVIDISGYSPDEKVMIARKHLIPKVLEEHGLKDEEIVFDRDAIMTVITNYTRESGVRQLEKKIAKVMRKLACLKASDKELPRLIDSEKVREFLGREEVLPELYTDNRFAGVVTGLAWTQTGGEILFIETSLSPGNGEKLTLTGNLGDVMKESAAIALQYLKAHASRLGIDPALFTKYNVHIHVPEGAIPKDGPSAGVTMATSLASAFTGRAVRPKLAMTGEITLRGKVLPVGGIKEKILAAKRAGIKEIIMCADNRRDIEEIPAKYLKGLEFRYVETVEEVLDRALLPQLAENRFEL